jgi:hypothetical protein
MEEATASETLSPNAKIGALKLPVRNFQICLYN